MSPWARRMPNRTGWEAETGAAIKRRGGYPAEQRARPERPAPKAREREA